ncbi:MAG: universal stress protein A [Halothiobacillaceae bacterium]|nr:MAG: universal stress protein A [Halothiobacillaceae bacterium]
MSNYQHILIATDLESDSNIIAERGVALARDQQARLSIIHVVELIPIDIEDGLIVPQVQALENSLQKLAQSKLTQLVTDLNLPQTAINVAIGNPKYEITTYAKEQQVDLIVVGKHRRRGLARLLGSTANGVVNHALCDTLIVNLGSSTD